MSPVCIQPPRSVAALASAILPVAGHDGLAAAGNLAGFANGNGRVLRIGDHDFDASIGLAGGGKPLAPTRMLAVGDIAFRQRRNRHRRFAEAVDLREPRAKAVERGQRVLDIHRRAAPDQRADILRVRLRRTRHQALDHGRRGEHGDARPRL